MKVLGIALCVVAVASSARADDQLAEAKSLYSAAAYEDALQSLNRVPKTPDVADQVDQYRVFCLEALGRNEDARTLAEQLVSKHPLIELVPDASPRLVAVFAAARRQVLPEKIRETFRTAVAAVEEKDYARAAPELTMVRQLLDASDAAGATDSALRDMRLLVTGFLNLVKSDTNGPKAETTVAAVAPGRPASATVQIERPGPTIYASDSRDITSPVALSQTVPKVPTPLLRQLGNDKRTGVVEVIIDEKGRVEHVRIQKSIHPAYDELVKARAAEWTYRPARAGTTPVKFRKFIEVVVEPN